MDQPRVRDIPVPPAGRAVIVHPHMFLSPRQARAILKGSVLMEDFVWQTANLAGFISGCYTNDIDMLRESFEDVVIEPQRAALIPGFGAVRHAALSAGALGFSISGAGPTLFAWCLESPAHAGREATVVALEGERLGVLELFHGPTAAFKDFGARFLAAALARLRQGAARTLQILVATSGDTGGAVAAAFHRRQGIEVAVLFPLGQVSPTQQQQLSCWGGNVRTLGVRGSFDECQRLGEQALVD